MHEGVAVPRIAVIVSLVDDENRPMARESWSPLGYEDLGNPNLSVVEGTLVNEAERSLLERLRTSIDRTLLSFARRERRRLSRMDPTQNDPIIDQTNEQSFPVEYMGEVLPPDPEIRHIEDNVLGRIPSMTLDEAHNALGMSLIADQPMVEEQREQRILERKEKRVRPVKRVSRYKRKPVI